jgi:hypothetical protein
LDSLVRIEPFQWVTRLEAGTIFSSRFVRGLSSAGGTATVGATPTGRIAHEASLA